MIARLEEPVQFDQHVCFISASAGTSISIDYPNPIPMSCYRMSIGRSMPIKKPVAEHRFAKDHQSAFSKH